MTLSISLLLTLHENGNVAGDGGQTLGEVIHGSLDGSQPCS